MKRACLFPLLCSRMLLTLWGGHAPDVMDVPLILIALVSALAWMRLVRAREERFMQMYLVLKLRSQDPNQRFGESRSYVPHLYRGAGDAWNPRTIVNGVRTTVTTKTPRV